MAGNTFGTIFCVSTFGESHGEAVGCIIDGCPAGLPLSVEDIRLELARRKPGGGGASTTRQEADEPEILSGVFEGKTLGTPIAIIVRNRNQRSGDYEAVKELYRPGHADWPWDAKYGFRDYRGGGRSSARETIGRVAAGAAAKVLLKTFGVHVRAWTQAIAGIEAPLWGNPSFNDEEIERNPLRVPCKETAEKIMVKVDEARKNGDSLGGIISCRVTGLPPGIGMPVFAKLDALLAGAVLSIGACKGIEFGAGKIMTPSFPGKNHLVGKCRKMCRTYHSKKMTRAVLSAGFPQELLWNSAPPLNRSLQYRSLKTPSIKTVLPESSKYKAAMMYASVPALFR